MPTNPKRLSQFWQELKRRNVVRVITVYAASAFVILELVDILAPSLRLPDWTLNLVLLLLCVGFIIAIILSWIYDVHPEGGIVKTEPVDKVKEEDVSKSSNSWKIASYISFLVIVGLIALNIFGGKRGARIDESLAKSIAVIPFHNYSGNPDMDYLCQGLTDEIISHLFKVKSFDEVRSLTSVLPYKDSDLSAIEIAEELSVNFILEGSYKRMGNELKITAQLIETKSDNHIWLRDYKLPHDEVMGIPGEVALQIANHLKAFITEEEQQGIETIPTNSFDAYDYYLLGKYKINNHFRDEDLWKAIEYFKQAVTIDPAFALAYSGLADAYFQQVSFAILTPVEAYPRIREYAQKALQLNEGIAYSHSMLGIVKQSMEYDYTGAEEEYKRALEIDPRNAEIHIRYARLLLMLDRNEEAFIHSKLASELDPNLLSAQLVKSLSVIATGTIEEGLKSLAGLRNLYPENPAAYWISAVRFTHLGRYDEALSMVETQLNLMGDDNISDEIGLLGYLYGQMDQKDKAQEQLARLDELSSSGYYVSPRTRVWIYLGFDNIDEVISILEEALTDHSIDPESLMTYFYPIESLQSDPRFFNLLSKIGLAN